MDSFLFGTYIFTIVLNTLVLLIIYFKWGRFFPRKLLNRLTISFIASIIGLCFLLIAELNAPYSNDFYFDPLFYLLYLFMYGCVMVALYQLVIEVFFSNVKWLKILGWLGLLEVILFFALTLVSHLTLDLKEYPVSFDLLLMSVFGVGFLAYVLVAIGSFRDARSDRLETKHRRGLVLLGIFGLLIAFGLSLIYWGLYSTDVSVTPDPLVSAYWLIWIDLVVIVFLFVVRKTVKLIG